MTGSVSVTVGNATYTFNIDKGDDVATFNQMIVLGNPPMNCKEIVGGKYTLRTSKADSNIFIDMVCMGKNKQGIFKVYKAKLGQYKDKSGFFWNNFVEDTYNSDKVANTPNKSAPVQEEDDSDDIPF